MATRRTNVRVEVPLSSTSKDRPSTRSEQLADNKTMPHLDSPPAFGSAWLPTLIESLLLAIYPGTLLLGSIYSTLTIDHAQTPYIAHSQSYDPANAPSYFAKKSNVFNRYFVKVGWAWVTIALALFVLGSRALGPVSYVSAPSRVLTRQRAQAFARWTLLTGVWYALTQQFFGPPLIDRGFRFTGGKCEAILSDDVDIAEASTQYMSDFEAAASNAACRLIGGQWKGGHDISGHVFLLVLGSAMLWFEVLPVVLGWAGFTGARRIRGHVNTTERLGAGQARKVVGETQAKEHSVIFGFALAVAALNWWMLLMTAAYFHTWFEKLTGLLVAASAIYLTYFVPRAIPAVRRVLGVPGI